MKLSTSVAPQPPPVFYNEDLWRPDELAGWMAYGDHRLGGLLMLSYRNRRCNYNGLCETHFPNRRCLRIRRASAAVPPRGEERPVLPAGDHTPGVLLRLHRRRRGVANRLPRPGEGSRSVPGHDDPCDHREGDLWDRVGCPVRAQPRESANAGIWIRGSDLWRALRCCVYSDPGL